MLIFALIIKIKIPGRSRKTTRNLLGGYTEVSLISKDALKLFENAALCYEMLNNALKKFTWVRTR